ncbi:MAG: hypothetical protein HY705_07535 [Gemmatimonadetes bacterium]|nr:hypothetical protein [Gemmatimonadota bacterium]
MTADRPRAALRFGPAALRGAAVGLLGLAAATPSFGERARPERSPSGTQVESLLVAARRAVQAWARHDFAELVGRSASIVLHLPGAEPSTALRPAQAAELLHAFADGVAETGVEVVVARAVDGERAYVEAQRVFVVRGTEAGRTQTIYLGMRRQGASYEVTEIRVVP